MTLDEAVLEYYKIVKEVKVGCEITDRVWEDLIPQINTYELSELDYNWKQHAEWCKDLPQYKNRFSYQDWCALYFILSTWKAQHNI